MGTVELSPRMEMEVRQTLAGTKLGINVEEVLSDLFSTNRVPLTGYRKMLWVVAKKEHWLWNEDPQKSCGLGVANLFRERNPGIPVRVLLLDLPMTHYGHIEKPREQAGILLLSLQRLIKETGRTNAALNVPLLKLNSKEEERDSDEKDE